MQIHFILLIASTFATGMMAGTFFIWTNTVKPGLGKLPDRQYLGAFQSMNKVILNATFFLVFFAAALLPPFTAWVLWRVAAEPQFVLTTAAAVIYLCGAFLVTIFGNVPLNNLLEKANLQEMNDKDAASLRQRIERRWNFLNLARTVASMAAFALLILICTL